MSTEPAPIQVASDEPAATPFPPEALTFEEARPFLRSIHDHETPGLLPLIGIATLDLPGPGGANHEYQIVGKGASDGSPTFCTPISFQRGAIHETGVNGLTNESLIAVVIDRLRGFQFLRNPTPEDGRNHFLPQEPGPFACTENRMALEHLLEAMRWLHKRTSARIDRGVEGRSIA